jgi:chromate transporter
LWRLAAMSLWLGVVGFGGAFAVIQQVKRTVVRERAWTSETAFTDSFGVAAALPGAMAPNLLAIVGVRLAGIAGGVLSATFFLLPSVGLMLAFGALYDRIRTVAPLASALDGMAAATVGVIAAVAFDLGRSTVKRPIDWLLAAVATIALTTHALTLLEVIGLAALCGAVWLRPRDGAMGVLPVAMAPTAVIALAASPLAVLLVVFARIGLATFGGGFAMIPAIEHEVVSVHHWLGPTAYGDAIVLGQITPGPVAVASTFIGYRVAGLAGAASATVGMFGPPLVLALAVGRSIEAFRASALVRGALRAIAPTLVGIMLAAAFALVRTCVHGALPAFIAVASGAVLVYRSKVLPLFVLAAGGAVMLAADLVR